MEPSDRRTIRGRRYTCDIGYFIDEKYWGQGIAADALRKVCNTIFEETEVVRIFAEVYAENKRSARVLEKAGFYHESTQKQVVVKDGTIIDLEIFVLLKEAAP